MKRRKFVKQRILALLLALVTVLGMLPATAQAASSEEEALGQISVYYSGNSPDYLIINGRVREQTYIYYNYVDKNGVTKQIPAYCTNPDIKGVPKVVPMGTGVEYLANEKTSDPKVFGIVASGYPHKSLEALGLQSVDEAYYATKTALWCYLLDSWDIYSATLNPAADQAAAQRVLDAAKEIYKTGMYWDHINHHADRKAVCTNRDERVQTSGRLSCKIGLRRKYTTTHGGGSRRLLPEFKPVY